MLSIPIGPRCRGCGRPLTAYDTINACGVCTGAAMAGLRRREARRPVKVALLALVLVLLCLFLQP